MVSDEEIMKNWQLPENAGRGRILKALEEVRVSTAKYIFSELDEIAEIEHGMSLESVLLEEPHRDIESRKKFEALKRKMGIE